MKNDEKVNIYQLPLFAFNKNSHALALKSISLDYRLRPLQIVVSSTNGLSTVPV